MFDSRQTKAQIIEGADKLYKLYVEVCAERDGLAQGLAYQETLIPHEQVALLRAEIERLRTELQNAIDLLGEARSNHIAGSGPDEDWDRRRVALSKGT